MIFVFVHSTQPCDQFQVHLRVRNTAEAIQRTGIHQSRLLDMGAFAANSPEAVETCQDADVIILHRYLFGVALERVQFWKAHGKKIIVDFDQALDLLTPEMPAYEFWTQVRERYLPAIPMRLSEFKIPSTPVDQFRWGLRLVDEACVPSARLADDWTENTRVFNIPDYINTDQYLGVPRQESSTIHIGVDGSNLTLDMLESIGMIDALARASQTYPDLHVHFINMDPPADFALPWPAEQCSFSQAVAVEEWPGFLSQMDIGLMPVVGGYALRRSWLRALEFMALKIPWLASDLPPYRDVGRFGLLVPHGERYWRTALFEVLSQLDYYRHEAAGEPFLFALSQDIQENVGKILSVYIDG